MLGLTFNKRLEQAIHKKARAEAAEFLLERMQRGLPIHLRLHETACVAVTDKKKKILDVGLNKPNDLVLDNFGTFLTGLLRAPQLGDTRVSLNNLSGVGRLCTMWGFQPSTSYNMSFNVYCQYQCNTPMGCFVQVGSGATAAARSNVAIETAFGTAPESGRFGASNSSYGGGTLGIAGSTGAGGAGTIREAGLFFVCFYSTGGSVYDTFMFFHDILGAPVAFVAGNTIIVSYALAM